MKIVQFVVSVHFFEDNHTVVPSEAKVVTERNFNVHFHTFVGRVVEIALRIRRLKINGGGDPAGSDSFLHRVRSTGAPREFLGICKLPVLNLLTALLTN